MRLARVAIILGLTAIAAAFGTATASAEGNKGAVYTISNEATGNHVLIFETTPTGDLEAAGSVATGGEGSGAFLDSQGAVVLSADGGFLFTVNAGSDEISAFAVERSGLELTDTIASGGDLPISITVHENLVYVLNSGGAGNIHGFAVSADGDLEPIPGSARSLSTNDSNPAQVSFSPDGHTVVVSERETDSFSTYAVQAGGATIGPAVQESAGDTPFGFAFDRRNNLIVSEAFDNADGASATSSYNFSADGDISVVTSSNPTNGTAACWVAITKNGRFAYVTNPGTDSITGYAVGHDGSLTALDSDRVTATTTLPVDEIVSGRYLYVLNLFEGITVFRIGGDGSLAEVGNITGTPMPASGLAAS